MDEPLLPPIYAGTSSLVYVRLHGRGSPTWYGYLYSDVELAEWAGRVRGSRSLLKYLPKYLPK
ncbi:hypothetical protein B9Q04_18415 [Candidatus Marsarchaeota G2 archaeon BE_D]|uniref:Uncharacterized protein n=1 Tax=Candidatus Marsarchaeota G2 archaeon BE_D TaxID=1978158 RepID=A0A2R6C4Z4_9ARCH|nr:MAG: hypothetical protein B9Q04_18415 [Candidatus Marsarchaeota G2 archaeon BE_D]